jgi:mannose-6-phosphate isomerase-like protein (cupin superfamily)
MIAKSFATPDEVRTPPMGRVEFLDLASAKVARMTLEPGWRWSESVKPIAGTESCQLRHVGVVLAGSLHVAMDDGTEADVGPGYAYVVDPGHDAWVDGDEPLVAYEFEGSTAQTYAASGA